MRCISGISPDILCMHNAIGLTYILIHYKECSQLAGNIMHALNVPADIYPSLLQAVQLAGWEYYVCSKCASQHTSYSITSKSSQSIECCCMIFILFVSSNN